jgi:hypothetical protein
MLAVEVRKSKKLLTYIMLTKTSIKSTCHCDDISKILTVDFNTSSSDKDVFITCHHKIVKYDATMIHIFHSSITRQNFMTLCCIEFSLHKDSYG